MTKKKAEPVEEQFFGVAPMAEPVKSKPFWKRRRFLVPVISALIGGAFGIKNPEVFVNMAADIHKNLQGHSTD